jgi:hypothetical protein
MDQLDNKIGIFSQAPVINGDGFMSLFIESSGLFMISSSEKGSYSYANPVDGPYFTYAFVEAINREVLDGKKASWDHLLRRAKEIAKK